jgi:hypothetical protein
MKSERGSRFPSKLRLSRQRADPFPSFQLGELV